MVLTTMRLQLQADRNSRSRDPATMIRHNKHATIWTFIILCPVHLSAAKCVACSHSRSQIPPEIRLRSIGPGSKDTLPLLSMRNTP